MPALRTAIALLLSLHVALPALAQPPPEPWEPGVRHLPLSPTATGEVPELRITPGLALTVEFDSPVRPLRQGGVELEERGRFRRVSLDEEGRVLTLVLAPGQMPEKPPRLTVHFADGAVPASAAFLLVAHPAQAETHVQVYRQPRSAEVCCAQADAEREKALRCQVELERTRAEAAARGPAGLIGLRSQGFLDTKEGVRTQLLNDKTLTRAPTNALKPATATVFRSTAPPRQEGERHVRVAVLLTLEGPGAGDWKAEGAQLASRGGAVRTVTVWQSPANEPGFTEVMVETELTQEEARGRFTLKLWDASGTRTVTLGGITFP
ncbi:DUF2381 family protein [Archangium sp.]|uniref:DUF2381 family protein n=1 Tax=Archangium sp. TaxID=1872627 RepID=UPI00286C5C12|nr:DUF2381 family protein [Archangium sp.]